MSILKLKMISVVTLLLGAAACKPQPVYPPNAGPRRPNPPQPYNQYGQRPPYYGDQGSNALDYNPTYGTQPTPPPAPPVPPRDQYPVAERTDNPNRVLSPYAPYNVIDVEGFRSGQLAKDPSNGKIFRVP
jgi:hypothetical protein